MHEHQDQAESLEARLTRFFGDYEARTNRALADPPEVDVEATAAAFADCFIEANPHGVVCGKNDQHFREAIPKGLEFYRSLGTRSMTITSLIPSALDGGHAMAKVHWRAEYGKEDGTGTSIDFDVIYLLQTAGEEPRIFGYITGDEQKAYEEMGLI